MGTALQLRLSRPGVLSRGPCAGVEGLSLELSSLVDIRDYVNKELALRLRTDIGSQGAFFTDLNGFQVGGGAPWGPHGTQRGWRFLPSQAPGCACGGSRGLP